MTRLEHKQARQAALLRLLRHRSVASQQEIVALMQAQGYEVTQASVSRDLRELGLVKAAGRYMPLARVRRRGGRLRSADGPLHELITEVDAAGAHLVVIRTPVGAASAVAVELDRRRLPGVVGTVAGDDTIFAAVRSRAAQGRLVALVKSWMSGPRGAGE